MKSGYDDFFRKAKQNSEKQKTKTKPRPQREVEQDLRRAFGLSTRPKKRYWPKPSLVLCVLSFVTLMLAGWWLFDPNQAEEVFSRIEVRVLGEVQAESSPKAAEKKDAPKTKTEAESAAAENKTAEGGSAQETSPSEEDLNHYSKLGERKKELDQREKELVELEAELQKQKVELDKRIKELQEVREQIATLLKDRVEVDQAKVDKLVEFYSNMKPKQAAEIIGTIDEDLAIEVLGKMKKKNAAEIMNLLPPTKAQTLSEKYAGYKKR